MSFLREVNATCYKRVPGIAMIAEESTAWPGVTRPVHLGGLGFGLKWNMGWMHDTLSYLSRDPVHRSYHHDEMTFSMIYAYSENYVLPLSHDEVVHGKGSLLRKMAGDEWRQFAGLRSLLAFMWAHPGKQLLFMGSEFGQGDEWSEEAGLQWHVLEYPRHAGVQQLVKDLNQAYAQQPALWQQDSSPAGFEWIDASDAAGNVLSFLRYGADGSVLACVCNFSAMPHHDYRIGLPSAGRWTEVLNTDAEAYGGSGSGQLRPGARPSAEPWHGRPASAPAQHPAARRGLAGPGAGRRSQPRRRAVNSRRLAGERLAPTSAAAGQVTGTIRAATSAPSAMSSTPSVPCGWRRRSVGEPGLKIRRPPSLSSSGMCECPKITRSADGNAARIRRSRPAPGRCHGSSRPRSPARSSCSVGGAPQARHVRAVVVAEHRVHRRVLRQLVENAGGADIAGVQDQVRLPQPRGDRRRAGLPAPRRMGIGQDDDAHLPILPAAERGSGPAGYCRFRSHGRMAAVTDRTDAESRWTRN